MVVSYVFFEIKCLYFLIPSCLVEMIPNFDKHFFQMGWRTPQTLEIIGKMNA